MYTDLLCNQKKIPRMHYEVWLGMHRFLEPQLHCLVSINTLYSFLMWHPQSVSDLVGEEFLHVSTCSDFWLLTDSFFQAYGFLLAGPRIKLYSTAVCCPCTSQMSIRFLFFGFVGSCTAFALGRSIVLLSPYALKHGEGWPEYTMALCIKVTNIQVRNGKSLGPPHRGAYDPFSFELPQDGTEAMLCTSWHVRALSNSTNPRRYVVGITCEFFRIIMDILPGTALIFGRWR